MSVKFLFSKELQNYQSAIEFMKQKVEEIKNGGEELIWFLEHEDVLTAGTSAKKEELLSNKIPVFQASRGGKYTVHSKGQRVVYLMLDLKKRAKGGIPDPKKFIKTIEEVIIKSLAEIGILAEIREGRVGVWVVQDGLEKKIASIGVRFTKGVTMHGFAINVCNDLSLFSHIIPCGITEYGVTSVAEIDSKKNMVKLDEALIFNLKQAFEKI